jgi:hypothetical protein
MKKITLLKNLSLVALLWITFYSAKAQINDTLVVQVSPTLAVKLTSDNLPELAESGTAIALIKQFQEDLARLQPQFSSKGGYEITYKQSAYLKVDSLSKTQVFVLNDKSKINYNSNRCRLIPPDPEGCGISDGEDILIYFAQLEELAQPKLIAVVEESLSRASKPERVAKNFYYAWQDDQLVLTHEQPTSNAHLDQIGLKAGMGAALIKNTGMVNIGFSAVVGIGSRGRLKHRFVISDEMNYVFDNNSSFTINNFLSFGYAMNFSKKPDKPAWYGLEAGFLTNKNSNFFANDTYRLGFIVNPVEKVNIKPFLYFEDGFKKVYPGIGLSFEF